MGLLRKLGRALETILDFTTDQMKDSIDKNQQNSDRYNMYINRFNSKSDDELLKHRDRVKRGLESSALASVLKQRNLR